MSSPYRPNVLLDYWFGTTPPTPDELPARMRLWFGDEHAPELRPQNDEALRLRFGAWARAAARGELDDWASSPRRRLALILLLDQLPRNLYRGTPQAFSQDAAALSQTLSGMQLGADAALAPVERMFFYMPLEHSESPDVQEESLAAFQRLQSEADAALRPMLQGVYEYARVHHDIIARFGRFPHRNHILGRVDTPEEAEWLRKAGPSFGQ
ncbi:MAG TPA: DUF924 family protein [Steroidobacteraceae bacterium]|nr:DUF924 family protein [Steroidobacteraceae bacterium]